MGLPEFDVLQERMKLINSAVTYLSTRWKEINKTLNSQLSAQDADRLQKERIALKNAVSSLCEQVFPR